MPDAVLTAQITAEVSDFQSKMQEAGGAIDDFASHSSALEQAYQSVSSSAIQAEQNENALANALMGAGQAADESAGGFASMAAAMAAGVVGGFGITSLVEKLKDGLKEMTVGTFEWGEKLTNLSIQTGLSTDQIQVLQYAATATGVSFDRLGMLVIR